MNKKYSSPFLFQNLIRFSLIAFAACVAGIFFQVNASAQNAGISSGDGSCWQNSNQPLLVGNNSYTGGSYIGNCNVFLTAGATLGASDFSIGINGTLGLGGTTQEISAVELADGSKIVNGTIILDPTLPSDLASLTDALTLFNIQKDENGNYDLCASSLVLPVLTFQNGGKIINGTLEIKNDPALIVIKEASSTPSIGYNPIEPSSNVLLVTGTDSTLVNTSTLVVGNTSADSNNNSLTVVSSGSTLKNTSTLSLGGATSEQPSRSLSIVEPEQSAPSQGTALK